MPIHIRDNRGGNWFWIHNAILDSYGAQIGVYGLAVYIVLCRHANEEQATWVGQKAIARELGCSDRQVRREIDKLVSLGVLDVQERVDDAGRTTNIYTLLPVNPTDSQSRGADSQSRGSGQAVQTPGPIVRTWNKTHGTRPIEENGAISSLEKLWQIALTDLAEQIVPVNYERWLARTRLLSRDDGVAIVGVPDQIAADQLARRFDPMVRRALGDALGEEVAVRYEILEP